MSAFGGKADTASASQNVRLLPKADMPLRREYLSDAAFRAPNLGLSTMFCLKRKALSLAWNKNSTACV
jgi:hypothetical protein